MQALADRIHKPEIVCETFGPDAAGLYRAAP